MIRLNMFLAIVFMLVFPVFAQAEAEEKTISGTVTDVNWVSLLINVRYYDTDTRAMDEVTIRVPKHLKITCGTRNISFSDVKQSDPVSVTFYSDDFSGFIAKRISDRNQANR